MTLLLCKIGKHCWHATGIEYFDRATHNRLSGHHVAVTRKRCCRCPRTGVEEFIPGGRPYMSVKKEPS